MFRVRSKTSQSSAIVRCQRWGGSWGRWRRPRGRQWLSSSGCVCLLRWRASSGLWFSRRNHDFSRNVFYIFLSLFFLDWKPAPWALAVSRLRSESPPHAFTHPTRLRWSWGFSRAAPLPTHWPAGVGVAGPAARVSVRRRPPRDPPPAPPPPLDVRGAFLMAEGTPPPLETKCVYVGSMR